MTKSHHKLLLGLSLLSLFPVAWIIYPIVIVPSAYTVCAFKTLTAKDCPFCGLTRALASAMHTDFQAAAAFHPFWWLAAMVIAITGIVSIFDAFTGGRNLGNLRDKTKCLDAIIIFALIALGLYRNI